MLQLRNIKKLYNRRLILEIPFLQLDGGIYWVKGANGSGKTTLLKMIAGLIPFEGEIVFGETSLKDKPLAYRRSISWAEAEPLFPTFLTGMELVVLYQDIRKATALEVDELLKLFAMEDYIHSPVGSYSAGMMKKLSLVLAFLGDTPVIVLDEPLITLDEGSLAAVCRLIASRSTRTLFLMSSHQEPETGLLPAGTELIVNHQTISN
ncbi:MAG: ATP-binding cassette domain-containing protein [Bacteroidetes bacterium]|nr:ATP-binding cassette domain-containing protein [Bacteroidota bacterium]